MGVFLSAVMVTVYLGSKRSADYDDQLGRLQENARYALHLLRGDIEMAGFYGGVPQLGSLPSAPVDRDCATSPWALSPFGALDLVDNAVRGGAPISVGGVHFACIDEDHLVDGSDILAVKRTAAAASLEWGSPVEGLTRSRVYRWFLRTDAGRAIAWQRLRTADFSRSGFAPPSVSLWKSSAKVFFLRSYSQEPDDGIPTLCAEVLAGSAMQARCWVEGVEALQSQLGVDVDGDGVANYFVSHPNERHLRQAVAVRLHVLVRSVRPIAGYRSQLKHRVGDVLISFSDDGYLRRVFSTTIPLQQHPQRLARYMELGHGLV